MSLLDLILRNVRRNFRLYTIYLFAMITGVIIHFTFSSLMYNEDILAALKNSSNFQNGVIIASVAIFMFIIFFILYANSFFMKQRKKELGMYLLFGMSERQITLMLFYETLALGAVSVVAGILLGGLLSKLFGMLLMNLMQYDQVISLSFPIQAIGSTIGVFLLLAIIISVQNFLMARRVQLIELFHAKSVMEKPIPSSPVLALLSILLLVQAFILVGSGKGSAVWQDYSLASMIAVTVGIIGGTYLFFHQFVGWLLQRVSRGRRYHEGSTVLWTSPLRFQMRSNTLNLTFISLFSAAIILLTSFVTINYSVQFEATGMNLPNDIAFQSLDRETNEQIDSLITGSEHAVRYRQTIEGAAATPVTDPNEAFENAEYFTPEVLLVPENTYNEVVALRGDDGQLIELQGNEAVALSQGMDLPVRFEAGSRPDFTVKTETETTLSLVEKKDYALLGWATDPVMSMSIKPSVLVISDEAYPAIKEQAEVQSFEIYKIEDARNAEELSKQVHAIVSAV
ncbi:MAG: hypothetical protein K0R28_4278, partial [Paenibacillus sp.]|nr:hypothetical protein [Paenibacillus sp.]